MGKRGPKPKGKVKIKWSPNFAYAIGLLVSDGSLSSNGRHISFVSRDREQLENFIHALDIEASIARTDSTHPNVNRVQFGDVLFYQFLLDIGLMPNKSKVVAEIKVPDKYFFDFLRGSFDGDGCTYSYWDKRWRSSFMFYTTFVSASEKHIHWLRREILQHTGSSGHISQTKTKTFFQLRYAKSDSLKILRKMYRKDQTLCLSRKRLKIEQMLRIVGEKL